MIEKANKATGLKELIRTKDEWVIGALIRLYQFQTLDEQMMEQTVHQNNLGFNALDAGFMSSLARHYLEKGYLTPRQINAARSNLYKYIGQLESVGGVEPLENKTIERKRKVEPEKKVVMVKYQKTQALAMKITFPYDPELVAKVKTLEGRRFHNESPRDKYWTAPLTEENYEKVVKWGFEVDGNLKEWYKKMTTTIKADESIEVPGLKMELFPFQKQGVAFIESRNGRALVADQMGLGKTAQALAWLQLHPELRPVIIIVPASVKLNWKREAEMWMEEPNVQVLNGKKPVVPIVGDIVIINYDILESWLEVLKGINPEVLVMDECFPAGTKICTPDGEKKIEQLKVGDKVYNATGIGIVEQICRRKTRSLIRLHLEDGSYIDCTPNHLFFTSQGWTPAIELDGKELLTSHGVFNIMRKNTSLKNKGEIYENLSNVRKRSFIWKEVLQSFLLIKGWWSGHKEKLGKKKNNQIMRMVREGVSSATFFQKEILRDILLSEMEDGTTRSIEKIKGESHPRETFKNNEIDASETSTYGKVILDKDEREQPNQGSKSERKNQSSLEEIWTPFVKNAIKGWKWKTSTSTSKNSVGCIRTWMENGISDTYKNKKWIRIPYKLQSRYSTPPKENMDRSRRLESFITKTTRKGQKERTIIEKVRVERVEIFQSRDNGEFTESVGKNRKGIWVYNIQVSGHPSYYVNDILVHNCHYCKNPKTKRTKAVKRLAKQVPHLIALTGTPVVNRPVEAFPVLNMLQPSMFSSFWHYAHRYCGAKKGYWGWDFTGATNTEELHEKLTKSVMIRRLKEDVLPELPSKIYSMVPMTLDNEKEYRRAEEDFIEWLAEQDPDKAKRARNAEALARIEALKQLTIKGKLGMCIEWIRDFLDSNGKLVVFCTHKYTIDVLMKEFGNIAVKVDGSVSKEARQEAVDKFQNDDSVRLFVGNVKAAGVGLTLTAASSVAFLELPWTPGDLQQAEDRIHRIGQKASSVNVYYLIAENTIEEEIAHLLDEKRKVLAQVLDGQMVDESSLLSELLNKYRKNSV